MQDRDPRLVEKILDGTADPEVMRQLDRVFDSIRVWQVDYGASPLFMKKLGEGTVPFMRWIYGYARQISGQLPFGKNKDAESRIAGILTLLAVAYLLQAAIHWIMARGQKPTVGKGQVEENAPGQFQPQGRQFVGKTGAGEEVFFRTAKYPYLNLVPLLNGAIDDARHGRLKDLPAAAQTLGQEGISAGPTLQSLTWVFGYKQPYDLYKSPSEIAADDLSGFVPFHRLNEYRNRLAQTKADEGQMYLTKPRGFWGNLELGLPPELRNVQRSVPEDRVLNKQTSEFVRLKPDAEALKEWAGINLRFVDPADYQLWQEEQREKGLKLDTDQSARLRKFVVDGLMDRGENAGRSRAFIEAMYDRAEKEAGRLGRVQLATIEKRIITGSVPRDQVDRLALAYAGDNPELQKEIVMLLVRQKPEGVTDEAWAEQNRADAKVLARQRLIQALRQRIQRERPQRTIEILREELAGERR
jgi:hypothetical protein